MNNGATQTGVLVFIGVVAVVGIVGAAAQPASAFTIIGFAGGICTLAWNRLGQMKAEKRAEDKAEEVKQTLKTTSDETGKQLGDIHTLVNSNMAVQLKLVAELSRWKSDREPGNVEFRHAAEQAEKSYREHEVKQKEVDRKEGRSS